MSWKSLVTAGLLCVLASPVLATPTITVTPSSTKNATATANGRLPSLRMLPPWQRQEQNLGRH